MIHTSVPGDSCFYSSFSDPSIPQRVNVPTDKGVRVPLLRRHNRWQYVKLRFILHSTEAPHFTCDVDLLCDKYPSHTLLNHWPEDRERGTNGRQVNFKSRYHNWYTAVPTWIKGRVGSSPGLDNADQTPGRKTCNTGMY